MKKIKVLSEAGKRGNAKRWGNYKAKRQKILVELSKYIDKNFQNRIMDDPIDVLEKLLKDYEDKRNEKRNV